MIHQDWIRKFLALFFRLLYHQFAWTYDLVAAAVSLGQWKEWIQIPVPYLGNGKILELGFGPGHLQVTANENELGIFGLDLSPQMAKIAQKRLMRKGYQPNLTLGDGRELPYEDQCFDQIIATFPTEYFLDSKTLQEAYRTLAPNGQIIVVPMAWITGKSFVNRFLAWVFKVTGQSIDKNHPSFEMGKKLIEQSGFTVNIHLVPLKFSEVLILIANKTTHS